jgi:hypothetical protein
VVCCAFSCRVVIVNSGALKRDFGSSLAHLGL